MHRLPDRSGAPLGPYAALVAIAIALCAWQAQLSRTAVGAHWSVGLLIVGAISAALLLGRARQRHTSRLWVAERTQFIRTWRSQPLAERVSVVIWALLIAGVVSWDLVSFIGQSHRLPTLSYFVGHVTLYPLGRGFLFALWLACGAYLVSAQRAKASR